MQQGEAHQCASEDGARPVSYYAHELTRDLPPAERPAHAWSVHGGLDPDLLTLPWMEATPLVLGESLEQ